MLPERAASWQSRLKDLVPGYGVKLNDNPDLAEEILSHYGESAGHPPLKDCLAKTQKAV